jgi:hypothetical protein
MLRLFSLGQFTRAGYIQPAEKLVQSSVLVSMPNERPIVGVARGIRGAIAEQTASFDAALLAVALLVVALGAALMGVQSDTWWQLRTGQVILATGSVPTRDIFSSTVSGAYWPNHEWLALAIFYGLYTIGGLPALLLGCTALVVLAWAGIVQLSEGPGRVRAAAVLLAMPAQSVIWSARPHLFSLLLVVVALLLLTRPRLHWLYPPLFLLWANLHAGVAFGGVVLVVAALTAIVTEARGGWRAVACRSCASVHWALITLLSGLATVLNPLGFGLWWYILDSFGDTTRTYLSEWQPPNLDWPASYPFFGLVALTLAAVLVCWRSWRGQRDWTLLLLALLFGWLGFRSMRHTAFFAVVAAPLLSRPFREWQPLAKQPGARRWANGALLAGLFCGSALIAGRAWAAMPAQPLSGALVAAVRRCPGTLFNTYDTGGPLIWQVPERAVFVDNRQDPYPADLLFRAALAEQQGAYEELFAHYNVHCALVPAAGPLAQALRRDSWQALFQDDRLVVLQAADAR